MKLQTPKQKYELRHMMKLWRRDCPSYFTVVVTTNDLDVKFVIKNTEHEQD